MTQEQLILKALMQLQVVNDTLDQMHELSVYRHDFKREVNIIQDKLSRRLDMVLRHSDDKEAKDYTEITQRSIDWWSENLIFE